MQDTELRFRVDSKNEGFEVGGIMKLNDDTRKLVFCMDDGTSFHSLSDVFENLDHPKGTFERTFLSD